MNSRNHPYLLLAAVLLVHILYFTSSRMMPPNPLPDSEEYLNASQNLYQQGILYCGDLSRPVREELYTRRPPLYPILIGATATTGSDVPVLLLQMLLSLLSVWIVAVIFRPFPDTGDPPASMKNPLRKNSMFYLMMFLLLLATPAQFIYSNRIMAEIPFQLILVLMACCIYRYFSGAPDDEHQGHKRRYVWSFYLLLTLGMATKPVLFPFLLPVVILAGFVFYRTRKRVWITALLLPVLWVTGYSLYNAHRTGSAQYSSIQTANLVNYNLRYYLMATEGPDKASEVVDELYHRCEDQGDYGEKNRCLTKGVREMLMRHPLKYGIYHLKGSVRYFLDPGRFDLVTFFRLEKAGSEGALNILNKEGAGGFLRFLKSQGWGLVLILLIIGLFKLFKLTGFMIYLFRGRRDLPFRIFLALLVGYLALVTGPLGASRFYLPVELLVIGASLNGWLSLRYRSSI